MAFEIFRNSNIKLEQELYLFKYFNKYVINIYNIKSRRLVRMKEKTAKKYNSQQVINASSINQL